MDVKQINQSGIDSLHHYFENDCANNTSKKPLTQDNITEMVKNQVNIYKIKNASLEVLRKNINVKTKKSWDKVAKQNKTK